MLKKLIKYTDFNGDEREEEFLFHLTQAELMELEMSKEGGMKAWLEKIVDSEDGATIMAEMRKIILGAYGKKSTDGRRFVKTEQIREEFASSEAYSVLFMEMVTEPEAAANFAKGLLPTGLDEVAEKLAGANLTVVPDESETADVVDVVDEPENDVVKQQVTREELVSMSSDEVSEVTRQISEGTVELVP